MYHSSPFDHTFDIVVESLIDDEWVYYKGYNSLSDDYAYTNATNVASYLMKQLLTTTGSN